MNVGIRSEPVEIGKVRPGFGDPERLNADKRDNEYARTPCREEWSNLQPGHYVVEEVGHEEEGGCR